MVQYSSLPVVKEKDESTTVFMDERNIIKLLSCAEIEHYPKDNHNGDSPFKIVNLEWLFKKKNLVLIGHLSRVRHFLLILYAGLHYVMRYLSDIIQCLILLSYLLIQVSRETTKNY